MSSTQTGPMRRSNDFDVPYGGRRTHQIGILIAEFDQRCVELEHQIADAENHARVYDPMHFAYPTFATAARERRAKLQGSAEVLRTEFQRLSLGAVEAHERQGTT